MTLLISSRGAGSGRWSPLRKEDAEEAQTGLASLSTMDEADEEPLPILEPADLAPGWEEEAQSCASVAERPSMRQPLPCLLGYLRSMA